MDQLELLNLWSHHFYASLLIVNLIDTSQVVSHLEHYLGHLEMSYLSPQTINQTNFATQVQRDENSWKDQEKSL